uniref:Peptidase C14 caspase domain-containing protein n=1 Tax=Alexandrium monilatum TaxID=311494 RepID=A0A7S4RGN1_9DINO|mmetsp:Transcript_103275/g.328449  ORF Transcript_103275/g.328449 Transcript_103275/m.328449 type:complete len:296 (+) Transcript_103275:65-952(+)
MGNRVCMYIAVQICQQVLKVTNEHVDETPAYDDTAPAAGGDGQVFVVICALDYKQTSNPLTCSIDGRNIEKLVRNCGIPDQNVTAMYDEQCTKENVSNVVEQVGGQCSPGDYFIFYYSGHGTNLQDISGDETDGEDEAFCFVTPDGQINYDSCMADDDFSTLITGAVDAGVKTIILTDCCHSGTICDFDNEDWKGRKAISITGCLDSQTSGDIGSGGIFTHSMLLAIGELRDEGEDDYSVAKLYNTTVDKDDEVFNSKQDITMQCAPGFRPNSMAWPLVPQGGGWNPPYGHRSMS